MSYYSDYEKALKYSEECKIPLYENKDWEAFINTLVDKAIPSDSGSTTKYNGNLGQYAAMVDWLGENYPEHEDIIKHLSGVLEHGTYATHTDAPRNVPYYTTSISVNSKHPGLHKLPSIRLQDGSDFTDKVLDIVTPTHKIDISKHFPMEEE